MEVKSQESDGIFLSFRAVVLSDQCIPTQFNSIPLPYIREIIEWALLQRLGALVHIIQDQERKFHEGTSLLSQYLTFGM
jgi:hypothetical protein